MQQGGWIQFNRVQDYLFEIDIYDQLEEVARKHGLPENRSTELLDLADAVMYGKIAITDTPQFIAKAFGLDEQKAQAVAADMAGYRLLPLSAFIPGVEEAITSWGGKIEEYPELRIEKPGKDDEIRSYANEIGLQLPDHLMKRFVYLSKGYVDKERDREATVTLLKRPMNIGGLALSGSQIDSLLGALDKRFGPEQAPAGKQSAEQPQNPTQEKIADVEPKAAEPKVSVPKVPKRKEQEQAPVQEEPKNEVVEVPETPVKIVEVQEKPKQNDQKQAVEQEKEQKEVQAEVVQEEPERPRLESKPEKQTSPRTILPMKAVPHALTTEVPVISGHLFEHEEKEVQEHAKQLEKKGLGRNEEHEEKRTVVSDEVFDQVALLFKDAKQSQKTARSFVDGYLRGRLDEQRADALLQDKYGMNAELAHQILAELKKGHAELHKVPEKKQQVEKSDAGAKERTVLDDRHAALTSRVAKESVEPVMPSARVSAARTKDEELQTQHEKVDQEKLVAAQRQARPERAKIRLSKPSLPPKPQDRPTAKVADVKKVEKLIGPIEELGTMGIAEFRRLSSDPKEAIEKMMHVLQLLEETDYEDRVRGVQAWRKSPLNELYVDLVQEALLNGETVADAATKRRNAGRESLSAAEIEAIVTFNHEISF